MSWLSAALRSRKAALAFEAVMLCVVLYSAWWNFNFLLVEGRLPPPFFRGPSDTIMDAVNVAFYSHNPGAYYAYLSVYPPIAFDYFRLFSLPSCYRFDPFYARDCDWLIRTQIVLMWAIAGAVTFAAYRKRDRRTALIRSLAITLGLPMLYGLERGNLVIVTYVFFVMAFGPLLRRAWLKWIAAGIAINFKPYLLVSLVAYPLKRRWRNLEGAVLATVGVYAVTFAILGTGDPVELATNIIGFTDVTTGQLFDWAGYSATYSLMVQLLKSQFPFLLFTGSQPIELMQFLFLALIHLGQAFVVLVLAGSLLRPGTISLSRLVLLAIAVPTTTTNVGGYSQVFLLFLVFLERWRGPLVISALTLAYGLSVAADVPLVTVARQFETSWLTNRLLGIDISVNYGQIIRPGMILLIQYLLATDFLVRIARAGPLRVPWSTAPSMRPKSA